MDFLSTLAIALDAGILIAFLAGWVGYLLRGERFRRRLADVPRRYTERLDSLILRAVEEGKERSYQNARAIVAARDNLQKCPFALCQLLDSEIDHLIKDIVPEAVRVGHADRAREDKVPDEYAYEMIQVLSRRWPTKKLQIEYELRNLLSGLGIENL